MGKLILPAILAALIPGLLLATPAHKVTLVAYINVSSGCQTPTVDLLNRLKTEYAPNVSLRIIDFGQQKGYKQWQDSGYHCMTIEVNGWPMVKFPHEGKMKAVALMSPAGLNWTHADLQQAVQAALQGKLQKATEAEVAASSAGQKLSASITTGHVTQEGHRMAAVLINGGAAVMIPGSESLARPRAEAVAEALRAWLAKPAKLSDLTLQPSRDGWKVMAGRTKIVTATATDGKAFRKSPRAVAQAWLSGIKYRLVARPGGG